jgi:hypothetical protein
MAAGIPDAEDLRSIYMFKKALLALAAGSALVAIPATANAQYGGYYPAPQPYYGGGYYPAPQSSYGYGSGYGSYGGYSQPYYGGGGYSSGYRCGNSTQGALLGGVAGAAIGSRIAQSSSRNRYSPYGYRSSNRGTTGALIGGVLGAVVGSKVVGGRC